MDFKDIKVHWESWAKAGVDLQATTKAATIKQLEIDALVRAMSLAEAEGTERRVLEAGCGNGQNCVALARRFIQFNFDGFDYVDAMIASAEKLAVMGGVADRTRFIIGDLRDPTTSDLAMSYDIVFTDRAIINLNSEELQLGSIAALATLVVCGGLFLLLENFVETYDRQNDCREMLGLPRRSPAQYNLFLSCSRVELFVRNLGFDLIGIDDFGSLHDLMLYVLVPAVNEGSVDYDHPMVRVAADLSEKISARSPNSLGAFGQNRLYIFRKRA